METPKNVPKAKGDVAKSAKKFINQTVPTILKSNKRARQGVETSRLIGNPAPPRDKATALEDAHKNRSSPMNISCQVCDTLEAAWFFQLSASRGSHQGKPGRIAILNMASPLRPGGGVLTGATSQEESLCSRTTLYPALREEFYRLPEIGGVYTQDILVCRGWESPSPELLPVQDRFFIDVVTSAMLRFPDIKEREAGKDERNDGDIQVYVEESDRELALEKMRAVMRMMKAHGVDKAVLGAWGCGAYANPVGEIARAWKRVLLGGNQGKKQKDNWGSMSVIFAIKNRKMAEQFTTCWGDDLSDIRRIITRFNGTGWGLRQDSF